MATCLRQVMLFSRNKGAECSPPHNPCDLACFIEAKPHNSCDLYGSDENGFMMVGSDVLIPYQIVGLGFSQLTILHSCGLKVSLTLRRRSVAILITHLRGQMGQILVKPVY